MNTNDFQELRERVYVDKSAMSAELIDKTDAQALALLRPPGFGKTLSLSMLRCFFEKRPKDLSHLFEGLCIWQMGEEYRRHFQKYPVLYISFGLLPLGKLAEVKAAIDERIRELFVDHCVELKSRRISKGKALFELCRALHHRHGERVIILLDDYDAPVAACKKPSRKAKMRAWLRYLLSTTLKDNPHLYKAVLAGTFRVPLGCPYSASPALTRWLLQQDFCEAFGTSEFMVEEQAKAPRTTPFFRLCFSDWLGSVVQQGHVRTPLEDLLAGILVEVPSPGRTRTFGEDVLWALVFTGCLKAEKWSQGPQDRPLYRLLVPNNQMRAVLSRWVR